MSYTIRFQYKRHMKATGLRCYICINYIIHCKIKRDNHQVHKVVMVKSANNDNNEKTKNR